MAFEKLEPKKPREITPVDSKEDLIKQAPEISDVIEKLANPDLTDEEFEQVAKKHNATANTPKGEVKRYSFTLENGRVIEIGTDDDGRVGINYKL
jgi:phage-related tail protein